MSDARALRERMAVVPQEGRAIPWMTPKQTISSYLLWRGWTYKDARKKAEESIAFVGLEEKMDQLNRTLSGGMRRKVLVAMVIASESDLIFLDEPSTGLDPISREELWGILTDLAKKRFLLLTTHYLEEAEAIADKIGILEEGRLKALGDMNDLRKRLRFSYSIRVAKGTELPKVDGEILTRRDGQIQIMTTEKEALRVSNQLIGRGVHFSVSPVTLEEIFYRAVGETNGSEGEL
jgi:ABC-2 type transport system ATP-binding protein